MEYLPEEKNYIEEIEEKIFLEQILKDNFSKVKQRLPKKKHYLVDMWYEYKILGKPSKVLIKEYGVKKPSFFLKIKEIEKLIREVYINE